MMFGWCIGWSVGWNRIELPTLYCIARINTLYIDIFLHFILLMTTRLTKSAVSLPGRLPNLAF